MKGQSDRTKVVLRHLPTTITQSMLMEQFNYCFAGRYNWISFHPGKISHKHQLFSRAYIDFKKPEDVIEFAAFFNGHVFVNEKGTQFKAIVEYSPSQRIPKSSKKDGREGTVLKDPEYLEFLEFLAKPVENLLSAEIQLERKEAEHAGAAKDALIVTPLMDYVRKKRAAKSGSRRSLSNGKAARSRRGVSSGSCSSSSKQSSERRKISSTMYILRDTAKSTSGKDKSTYILVPKQDDEQISDKFSTPVVAPGSGAVEQEIGVLGTDDVGKKKILILKGKEKDISHQSVPSLVENSVISTSVKQNPRRDGSGRIIRSILLSKDTSQNLSSSMVQSNQQIQNPNQEEERRPTQSLNMQLFAKETNGKFDDNVIGNDLLGFSNEKQEKRGRNKDKPERGVWAPLRRSDGSHTSDESFSSFASQASQSIVDSAEGIHREKRNEMPSAWSVEYKSTGRVVGGHTSFDNGSHKRGGRRGQGKDGDSSSIVNEVKSMKRGGSGYGTHEKQVWVQKSSSGS